jgi:hypothetical protein
MNSQSVPTGAFVSPFSLAFMEDTGWYRADYTAAAISAWGVGQGCAFAEYDSATQTPCGAWATLPSVVANNLAEQVYSGYYHPDASQPGAEWCTGDHTGIGRDASVEFASATAAAQVYRPWEWTGADLTPPLAGPQADTFLNKCVICLDRRPKKG